MRVGPGEPPPIADLLGQRLGVPEVLNRSIVVAVATQRGTELQAQVDRLLTMLARGRQTIGDRNGLLEVPNGFEER